MNSAPGILVCVNAAFVSQVIRRSPFHLFDFISNNGIIEESFCFSFVAVFFPHYLMCSLVCQKHLEIRRGKGEVEAERKASHYSTTVGRCSFGFENIRHPVKSLILFSGYSLEAIVLTRLLLKRSFFFERLLALHSLLAMGFTSGNCKHPHE